MGELDRLVGRVPHQRMGTRLLTLAHRCHVQRIGINGGRGRSVAISCLRETATSTAPAMVRAVPDGSLPFCLAAVVAFEDRDFVVVQRIPTEVARRGAQRIELHVYTDNADASRFYKEQGFVRFQDVLE